MVITDELIAAYVDGNVTIEERRQVRCYLAVHPEEQDLVLALMDEVGDYSEETEISLNETLQKEQSFTDIAYAAAAFAPRKTVSQETNNKTFKDKPQKRRLRMSALWDELQKTDKVL